MKRGKMEKKSPNHLPKLYANNQHKFKTNKKQYSDQLSLSFNTVRSWLFVRRERNGDKRRRKI